MTELGLPLAVQRAIDEALATVDLHDLRAAASEISRRYRDQVRARPPLLRTQAERLAYLAVRSPASYAAARLTFAETAQRLPSLNPASLLDVGSGPGTVVWAALDQWPDLRNLTLLEQDLHVVELARQVAAASGISGDRRTTWTVASLPTSDLRRSDVVCATCTIGELPPEQHRDVVTALWQATEHALVVIEPGTPRGFHTIIEARRTLLQNGAHVVAPCPTPHACPKVPGEGWCHFAARLPRSEAHRLVKQVTLPYEDEKYSYVVASRSPGMPVEGRVLSPPTRSSSSVSQFDEPGAVLAAANEVLCPDIPQNMFATCLYGVLDPSSGRFRFANAGHNPPCVQTDEGAEEVMATGMPLGLMPGATYEETETVVADGKALLLYSDALPEAHGARGEMFGFPRVHEVVGERTIRPGPDRHRPRSATQPHR